MSLYGKHLLEMEVERLQCSFAGNRERHGVRFGRGL